MADDLRISIGADNSGLRDGLRDSERAINDFVSKVEKLADVGDKLKSIGQNMTLGISVPLLGLGGAAIKAYGDIEALKKGLEAVTGSTENANKEFEKLKVVAQLPGLGMEEAVRGSIGLQAIGISADRSRKILEQFGNAVATVGKGTLEFERAIYGVQQLANTDFPLGEDLNIIKDALPQVSSLLKEAFGTSRSDELQKMGVSSQQVLDTILTGLEKLPRVTGGINGAFENLSDSIKQSLARVGDVINKNLDISNVIAKLTSYIDKAVTAFENLSPSVQKAILIVGGLVAAAGPLIAALGTIMALVPTLTAGVGALSIAFSALVSPIGLTVAGLSLLSSGFIYLMKQQQPATQEMSNWEKSLQSATLSAQKEVATLDKLYATATDVKKSVKERKAAVEEMQILYPNYLGNLSNEAIMAGNAAIKYNELRIAIVNASRARAAQAELDKRNNTRIQKELELREQLKKQLDRYNNPTAVKLASGGFDDKSFKKSLSAEEVKEIAKQRSYELIKEIKSLGASWKKEDEDLLKIIENGADAQSKLITTTTDNKIVKPLKDTKKKVEKAKKEIDYEIQKPIQAKKNYLIFDAKIIPNIDTSALETRLMELTNLARFEEIQNNFEEAANNIMQSGIMDTFYAIGEAIGSGSNVLAAAGSMVLNTLSQFVTELGKSLVNAGIATVAYGKLISGILEMVKSPWAAVALGLAAIAVGGLLSSVSKSVGNVGSGDGGGSISSSAGVSSSGSVSSYTSSGGVGNTDFRFVINGYDLVSVVDRNRERMNRLNSN